MTEGGSTTEFRLANLERDCRELWSQTARSKDVEALAKTVDQKASLRDLDALTREVGDLAQKVASNTKALLAFALTVAGSAIGLALAVLQGGGHG